MIAALRVNAPRGNNKVAASNRCRVGFVSSTDTLAGFDWGDLRREKHDRNKEAG